MTGPAPLVMPDAVVAILRRLEDAGHETWCVGGAIRDGLLGSPGSDVDLATAATPDVVRRLFPRTIPVGIEHGTVGVLDDDGVLHEVAGRMGTTLQTVHSCRHKMQLRLVRAVLDVPSGSRVW